jgi:hypothetical protein
MNKAETLKLFAKGRDAWNAWAQDQLSKKVGDTNHQWAAGAQAVFSGHTFNKNADFRHFIFPGTTDFENAHFQDSAHFDNAEFQGEVWFVHTRFEKGAFFVKSCFSKNGNFLQVSFEGFTSFSECHFHEDADFSAVQGKGIFDLTDTTFDRVPDFIQAHFAEAPRLDNIKVPAVGLWRSTHPDSEHLSACYRALKRIAIQGHDHDREIQFFANEIRSLRGSPDKPWHARYWVGYLYEVISDFGRSISRPFIVWLIVTGVFAALYLQLHLRQTGSWTCIRGGGDSVSQAIYLAVRKGLVFPALGSDPRLDAATNCLFGDVILDSISYAEIAQSVISAALIFLFLLAVRNHFRIK